MFRARKDRVYQTRSKKYRVIRESYKEHVLSQNHLLRQFYHGFPGEVISHAVWLYDRLCLSHRDVEERLLERGFVISYEAVRKWSGSLGKARQ